LIVAPPLVITRSEIDELIAKAALTLDQLHAGLTQDGWLPG
jgi:adenosylmethionine-8-amino-7-oxononanoate aminotransferase